MAKTSFSAPETASLLHWYDQNSRKLPWRSHNGRAPSPYHTWLSEIMLQQTTVATVIPYYMRFTERWPDVMSLAHADEQDVMHEWAGLGYYSRARNLLACARQVATEHGGVFPSSIEELKALPGIGDYTANAIRAIAFDLPANVVDGNVERVMARMFAFEHALNIPQYKKEIRQLAASVTPAQRHGDYAQALMDLGATICTPRQPQCHTCPWQDNCRAFALGLTDRIPVIQRRAKLPERHAHVFILTDIHGRIFLRQRPATGLLGGLWECPSTPWSEDRLEITTENLPTDHAFDKLPKPVIHVFSHFKLTSEICVCRTQFSGTEIFDDTQIGGWFALDALPPLSTLSKKIMQAGLTLAGLTLGDTTQIL